MNEMDRNDEKNVQDVLDKIALLAPEAADAPQPARQALNRVQQQVKPRQSWRARWRRWLGMGSARRGWAAAVAALLLVFGLAFTFPTVRAAASDFLGLFRVQKFAAVSISPQQIALLEEAAEQGIAPGEVKMLEPISDPQPVESAAAAARQTGLAIRQPSFLPEPEMVQVADGGRGQLIIDLAGARALLEAAGADPALLADELDGAAVDVTVYPGVEMRWADDDVTLLQMTSPTVTYPAGLDPVPLGEALLQVLGVPPAEAARLAREIDWTGTLLLPVPQTIAAYQEVTVNGQSGLALRSLENEAAAVLWQHDGVLYLLEGETSIETLIDVAESLQ